MVKLLIKSNVNLDKKVDGVTALELALDRDDVPIKWISKLITPNNINDPPDYSPLMQAIEMECWDIVRVLVESGADINSVTARRGTPLHYGISLY